MLRQTFTAVLLAGLTLSAAAAEVKTGHKAAAEAKSDDVICTYEQPLGSHIRKRTCATRAQRDQQRERDQEAMQRMKQTAPGGGVSQSSAPR